MSESGAAPTATLTARKKRLGVVYLAVFGGYTGQQILTPILPPLIRDLSLSELQYGLVMSASALVVTLVSARWGRVADRWGRQPLMITALVGAALGLLAFAGVVRLGLSGALPAVLVFVLLLLSRGLLFGGSLAALPVSAQSYVADSTPEERERVRGLARVGAAVGLGLVLGPGLGGVLARLGPVTALLVAPALLSITAIVVALTLPRDRPRRVSAPSGDQPPPTRLRFGDPRIRAMLGVGAGTYLSTSLLQISMGFLIQDRLNLDTVATAELAGLVLLAGGLPMLVVQGLVIPRLDWSPRRLLSVGLPLTAVAFVGIALSHSLVLIVACSVLSGIGHSLAIPGYTSGVSLRVGADEQGAVAGLAGSVNAATLTVGPLLATGLYQLDAAAPYVLGAVELALVWILVRRIPETFRTAASAPDPGLAPDSGRNAER